MKRRCVCWLLLFCLALLLCGFDRERQKVYDNAGLLSTEEREELQAACVSLAVQEKMDVIILTSDAWDDRSAEEMADDFYDEQGFGYEGPHETGIILAVNMYTREFSITTSGYAIEWFTDREIEQIYDRMEGAMRAGDYAEAFRVYLAQAERLKNNSESAENGYYDPGTQTFVSTKKSALERTFSAGRILGRLLVSALIGAAGVLVMRHRAKPRMSVGQNTYLKDGRISLERQTDRFTHETQIHRRIPKQPPQSSGGGGGGFSSVHRSGGGFSHGGGGGRHF